MKTSVGLFLTDILPHRRSLYNHIVKNKILGVEAEKAYKMMKKSGIEGVEIFLPSYAKVTAADIAELKETLKKHDFPVFSVHQQLRFLSHTRLPEIRELFQMAAALSARVIVLHMSTAGKMVFDPHYISQIHKMEKEFGIKAGFENREKYFASLHVPYGWDEIKFGDLMDQNDFAVTLDTTHLAQSGGDIIAFFKKNKKRIVNIHISDYKDHPLNNNLRPLRYKHLPLGEGELPIHEFLRTLCQENYTGLVTMEIHTDLEGICQSAKIINAITKN